MGVLHEKVRQLGQVWRNGLQPERRVASFDTAAAANAFFDDLTGFTKDHLCRFRDGYLVPNDVRGRMIEWARKHDTFPDMCSGAKEIIGHNVARHGLDVRGFETTQMGRGTSHFEHCATIIPFHLRADPQLRFALMDPTIGQFALPPNLYEAVRLNEAHAGHSPERCLKRTDAGRELWGHLATDGYAILTPHRAQTYLQAFFPPRTFTPDEACHHLTSHPFREDPLLGKTWVQEIKALDFVPRTPVPQAAALLSAPSTP